MSTTLGTLINRMDRYQAISKIDAVYKVQDIDDAIRSARRICKFPWDIMQKNLKIFADIVSYNPESDFDGLAYLDDNSKYKTDKPDFQYTSLKQFFEDPTNRNLIAEIWNEGQRTLGVKYKNAGLSQIIIDNCSDETKYSVSGDFISKELEEINTAVSSYAIKLNCTENTDIATVSCYFTDFIDAEYKKKYFFVYLYLASVPTSIDLKLKKDDDNYLSKNILTQFDGSIFKAGEYNVLAFDLNDCIVEGATGGEFNSYDLTLNGISTGTYYIADSFLKEWKNLNYAYYSNKRIKTTENVYKEQFLSVETNEYDLTDVLIGEDIFSDIILIL